MHNVYVIAYHQEKWVARNKNGLSNRDPGHVTLTPGLSFLTVIREDFLGHSWYSGYGITVHWGDQKDHDFSKKSFLETRTKSSSTLTRVFPVTMNGLWVHEWLKEWMERILGGDPTGEDIRLTPTEEAIARTVRWLGHLAGSDRKGEASGSSASALLWPFTPQLLTQNGVHPILDMGQGQKMKPYARTSFKSQIFSISAWIRIQL